MVILLLLAFPTSAWNMDSTWVQTERGAVRLATKNSLHCSEGIISVPSLKSPQISETFHFSSHSSYHSNYRILHMHHACFCTRKRITNRSRKHKAEEEQKENEDNEEDHGKEGMEENEDL